MKRLYALLSTICVCMNTLWGTLPAWRAFVPSADSYGVYLIPLSSYQAYPIAVEYGPSAVAITPDAQRAVVVNETSETLSVLDLTTFPITSYDIPMGTIGTPTNIAITPDGTTAVVICAAARLKAPAGSSGAYAIVVLDMTAQPVSVVSTIQAASGDALAITPDGKRALVGLATGWTAQNPLTGVLGVVDLTTTPVSIITTAIPFVADGGIAVTPDGTRALAVTQASNSLAMIDLTTPIPKQICGITVGQTPIDVAITPDGKRALVVFSGNGGGACMVDLAASSLSIGSNSVSLEGTPTGVAITPDGKTAAVTVTEEGDEGFVVFLDLTTPLSPSPYYYVPVPSPADVAITPDQAPTAQFTFSFGHKGDHWQRVHFDASASTSPIGDIVQYAWDFDDGRTAVTTTPTTSHVYRHPRKGKHYQVRLTVTNSGGTSTDVTFTGRTVSNNGGPSASCVVPLVVHPK